MQALIAVLMCCPQHGGTTRLPIENAFRALCHFLTDFRAFEQTTPIRNHLQWRRAPRVDIPIRFSLLGSEGTALTLGLDGGDDVEPGTVADALHFRRQPQSQVVFHLRNHLIHRS